MSGNVVALADLRERMSGGLQPILDDVRTPGEFARLHAAGARSIPLDKLDAACVASIGERRSSDGCIYVICHSGTSALLACQKMTAAGVRDVFVIGGGTEAWKAAGSSYRCQPDRCHLAGAPGPHRGRIAGSPRLPARVPRRTTVHRPFGVRRRRVDLCRRHRYLRHGHTARQTAVEHPR